MTPRLFSERLYLSRERGADVFVPEQFAHQLRPFQRDGIRFLYRLFAKKSPGAILNDPAAYGKTVQAVLFIDAVSRSLQPPPALVLCSPDDVSYWKYHFHLWTDSANELDESVRMEVSVSPIHRVSELIRREWGIVVVDNVDVTLSTIKNLKSLKAQFKVWLTNENLLKNVTSVALIHEWINNDKIKLSLFEKVQSKRQIVEQAISLDTLCQNFILRRTNEDLPLTNQQENMELFEAWKNNKTLNRTRYFKSDNLQNNVPTAVQPSPSATPLVSIKNKDPTGLKVKRTKKIHNSVSDNGDLPEKADEETEIFIKKPRMSDFGPMLIAETSSHSIQVDHRNKQESLVRQVSEHRASERESSMKRIEELANRQFKGSILDSLF